MEVYVMASGSKGNVTAFKTTSWSFLVDCGLSFTQIKQKMAEIGHDINTFDTLFLTHEHHDHTSGLASLLKQDIIKQVILSSGTYQGLTSEVKSLLPQVIIVKADSVMTIGDFEIKIIQLSHDANEPIGFIFNYFDKKVVLLTDTGYVDSSYVDDLMGANLYILESNHCPTLLMKSSRPFFLKQRIIGMHGHLSNDDAAILVKKLVTKPSTWVVAHISELCNKIECINQSIDKYLSDINDLKIIFSSQTKTVKLAL